MLELQGKFGTAKVFTDVVDNESISQVINLLNQPYIEGSKVRMMPDIHAGAGCTIGTTMTIKDKICPNLVGVDIGCGMETIRIKETHIEPQKLDKVFAQGFRPVLRFAQKLIDTQTASTCRSCAVQRWSM